MNTLQTIEENMRQLEYIRNIMETYEAVAAAYMRRAKKSIVESRSFYEGLMGMYDEVSRMYQKEITEALNKRTLRARVWKTIFGKFLKPREACVLLSANAGLYGDIIQKTFQAFLQYVLTVKTDIIIVGKRGKTMFDEHMPNMRYTFVDLPDAAIEVDQIAHLTKLLTTYKEIRVFYGKFESFVSQIPASSVLGGIPQVSAKTPKAHRPTSAMLYLFEPSLKEIARFFETEIFISLFQQLIQEGHLAKLAARMYQLDNATENIGTSLHTITFEHQRMTHQLENKKQLETINSRFAIGI